MYDPQPGLAFVGQMSLIPLDELIKVRYLAHGFPGFDVCRFGLCEGDSGEGFNLTREIRCGRSEGGKTKGGGG